MILLAQE
jgi:hypothetical protein